MTQIQKSTVYYQYKKAVKMNEVLDGVYDQTVLAATDNLNNFYDLDAANGLWLDQLGKYLGYQRPWLSSENAFICDISQCDSLVDLLDGVGGKASDEIYRLLLKCLIARRNSKFTINDILQIIETLTTPITIRLDELAKKINVTIYVSTNEEVGTLILLQYFDMRWFGTPTGVEVNSISVYPFESEDIAIGSHPLNICNAFGHIWTSNSSGSTVSKISPFPNTVSATISVGSLPRSMFPFKNNLWVTNYGSNTVSKINPLTNTVTSTISVGTNPWGITSYGDYLYVANRPESFLSKIDPVTNTEVDRIYGVQTPIELITYDNFIWATSSVGFGGNLLKIDPISETVLGSVSAGVNPIGLVELGGYIWIADINSSKVIKIDPKTMSVVKDIIVGDHPWTVITDGTSLYVAVDPNVVKKIDPVTDTIIATTTMGAGAAGLTVGFGCLWSANYDDNTATARSLVSII